MPTFPLHQIAARVDGELIGDGETVITGVENMDAAGPAQLTFIGSEAYAKRWPASKAGAALSSRKIAASLGPAIAGRSIILVDNADLAMATVLELFAPAPAVVEAGVHPSAVIHPTARVGASARI